MELRGINAIFIKQYIEFKRNLGYAYKNTYNLTMFDRFTIENGVNTVGLTRELANKWMEKRPNESELTRYKRVGDVINFSKYLNHLGYYSFIPKQTKSYRSTFTPYIFSHDKMKAFFSACDSYEVRCNSSMKYVIPSIFRVIYGCGLRANEALSLKCRDVHLDEKYIVIREAKNGCERILPISDSLAAVCDLYRQRYLGGISKSDYFFQQKNRTRYAGSTLYKWFRKIIWKAGISHGGKGLGPRVHDLRHTFSVHSLETMSRRGLDLYYSLPILCKYLGHRSLEATDSYVRLTFDMYPELVGQVDNLCAYVFPEVEVS